MKITLGIMTGVMIFFGVCSALVTTHACSAERLPWLWPAAVGPADSTCSQAGPGEQHGIPTQAQGGRDDAPPNWNLAELRSPELWDQPGTQASEGQQGRAKPSLSGWSFLTF